MSSKKLRRVLASVAAVAMLSGAIASPMSVFAGEQLGQVDFDEGIGLPWHICESATGKMTFDISGGTYNIEIVNPGGKSNGGEDRWDCQFRHRGLRIEQGHEYTLTYEITASNAGKYYSKIGNLDAITVGEANAGEVWHNHGEMTIESSKGGSTTKTVTYGEGWNLNEIGAGETLKVTSKFTACATLEVAEWAFHLGGDGQYTPSACFPKGTKITFDNMSLIDNTSDEYDYKALPNYDWKDVAVNQLGYVKGIKKQATYAPSNGEDGRYREPKNGSGTVPFEIKKGGTTVYTGKSNAGFQDPDSGNYTYVLDFTDFDTVGEGYTVVVDGCESYPFAINTGDKLYDGLYEDAMNYFYLNRSGIDIESKYVVANNYDKQIASAKESFVEGSAISKSGLAREAGHPKDNAYIQSEWVFAYATDGSDVERTKTQDVTGGWYDAGDYGKYVVNGGISVWTLANIYERAVANGQADKYGDSTLTMPEAGNKIPDILDECKYEMDFFLKMMVKEGSNKGMVYHKMHDFKWTGLAVSPADSTALSEGKDADKGTLYRIIKPASTAATLNLSASAAQLSRLIKDFDSDYAAECLEAAKTTYEAAKKNPDVAAPLDQNIGGGPYGDTYFDDEFYWAACELWLTTGDDAYLADMKKSTHYLEMPAKLTGGENNGDVGSFNWGNVQGLGTASLACNYSKLPDDMKEEVFKNICATADEFIKIEESQGYGIPFAQSSMSELDGGKGYTWGSNSFAINNAIVLGLAYNVSGEQKYLDGASVGMDYIMGRNAMENSYVTGYGTHHTTFVHHRYWSAQMDASLFTLAPSGVLSGGPNSAMQDPYVKGAGYKVGETAPQLCYLDHIECWSTNECTVNWNSPLAWMADFMTTYQDIETAWSGAEPGTEDPGTEDPGTEDPGTDLKGDVDLNGVVDLSDLSTLAVAILENTTIEGQGGKNADVNSDGKVNLSDLARMRQFLSHKIEKF
jgi:endoglucanase